MDALEQITKLLHEAADTHHQVYRIVDGDDPDWASWYADWLIDLSELPEILGGKPVRSELVYELVKAGRDFAVENPQESWHSFYARALVAAFKKDS